MLYVQLLHASDVSIPHCFPPHYADCSKLMRLHPPATLRACVQLRPDIMMPLLPPGERIATHALHSLHAALHGWRGDAAEQCLRTPGSEHPNVTT